MDVIVNVRGRGGLAASPEEVEVRVEDWRGMPHKTDALVADVTVQACEAYERMMREQRVIEHARSERKDVERRQRADLADGRAWLSWADGLTPGEVGDWDRFVLDVSAAVGEMDTDWLDGDADRPLLQRIAERVAEITTAMVGELDAEALERIDARFGTCFGFNPDEEISEAVDGMAQATDPTTWPNRAPDVPVLADPSPSPHASLPPKMRCAQIGEHDPHTWSSAAGGPYHCEGEVF